MTQTIMIIDDEIEILDMLKRYFSLEGYHVITAAGGKEALQKLSKQPDLILLDINMPDIDGLSLCKSIRDFVSCPILFLTANVADSDKIKGFTAGGDDYIVKPFAMDELMARMEMVLRRAGKGGHQLQAFDVTLDSAAHMVLQRGQPVELTPREFALLEQLMRNRGAAIYRDTLMERAWGGDAETTRAVDTYITRLRKKLNWGDKIETVYQIGYRLKQE